MINQNYIKILDEILLSKDVVNNFNSALNNKQFYSWLQDFIPEILECKDVAQKTPWHIYDVLQHILHSIEEINKQTENLDLKTRRMLAYVMLFHDIGKPSSKTTQIKNGTKIDRFFNHNLKSVEIAKKHLPSLNFSANEANQMLMLIEKHDIFMFIKDFETTNKYWRTLSNQVILDEINDLDQVGDGKVLMDYLIKVGLADSLSQNPEITGEALALLNKMQIMLYKLIKK